MESLMEYSDIYTYWINYCQREMEWFYFDNMVTIHVEKPTIDNQFPFMVSVIKSFSLLI